MSKLNSMDLFSLIKSMTKSEKRHFKLYASKHIIGEENNYIKLFDAIDKQKVYDEQKFKREGYIKQLPLLKNRLYELILKRLSIFHSERSLEIKVKNHIKYISILFEKSLYDQCYNVIVKAKEIAKVYEYHMSLLELLFWELRLIRIRDFVGKTEIEQLFQQLFETSKKIENVSEYELLFSRMMLRHSQKGYVRNKKEMNFYHSIMQSPLLADVNKTLSYQARYLYYNCFDNYFLINNDVLNAYAVAKKKIELFEENPHQKAEKVDSYFGLLTNLSVYQFKLKKFDEVATTINKIRAIKTDSVRIKTKIFYLTINLDLTLCINLGDFEKGKVIAENFERSVALHEAPISKKREILLFYEMTCVYFLANEFGIANKYINKILNNPVANLRSDLYCFAKIISLIISFERSEHKFLWHQVKSTYSYIYKKEQVYQFEETLLTFIKKKLLRVKTQSEIIKAFVSLKVELIKIFDDPLEQKAMDYFDFISWIESKIEKRSFAEIVKEKSKIPHEYTTTDLDIII